MKTIGERLRAARQGKGVSLQEISDETKISPRYLEAIEKGDLSALPGTVFARNFTRQYAKYLGPQYLGVQGAELEDQIRLAFPTEAESLPPSLANAASSKPTLTNPIELAPLSESWNWNKIGLSFAALVAVLGASAAIYRIAQEAPAILEAARTQAERSQANEATTEPVAAPAPPPSVPTASIEVTQTQPGQTPSISDPSQALPVSASTGQSETTITISTSGMAIRVVAEQDTWVSMTANGAPVFSEIIKANESRTISGVSNARLVVGNAGGIKIARDGQDIGPIGPPGKVRVVMISPEGSKVATGPVL